MREHNLPMKISNVIHCGIKLPATPARGRACFAVDAMRYFGKPSTSERAGNMRGVCDVPTISNCQLSPHCDMVHGTFGASFSLFYSETFLGLRRMQVTKSYTGHLTSVLRFFQ